MDNDRLFSVHVNIPIVWVRLVCIHVCISNYVKQVLKPVFFIKSLLLLLPLLKYFLLCSKSRQITTLSLDLLPCLQLQERQKLEEERRRVEALKRSCEEKEKLIPSQPESQREQLTVQLQQVNVWAAITSSYDQMSILEILFYTVSSNTSSMYIQRERKKVLLCFH